MPFIGLLIQIILILLQSKKNVMLNFFKMK